MDIKYSKKSVKQISKIHKGDGKSAKVIIDTIESYANNPSGNFDIKILKGKMGDLKRLRIGDYRVIFEIEADTMFVYEIKHRQGAYND